MINMKPALLNPSQAHLKKWAKLADVKVRQEEGIFCAEGVKVTEELLGSNCPVEALLVLTEKNKYWEDLVERLPQSIPVYGLTRSEFKKLSQDKEPEGILALVSLQLESSVSSFLDAQGHILILHEINNPQNLGALMRSAYWFGFTGIILSANCVDYTHPKVVRASMGSIFHLKILSNVDVIDVLPQVAETHYVIGSDVRNGVPPHPLPRKTALLLGSESHGLPEILLASAHERWCIPGNPKADSLSLPQAAVIMMYEIMRLKTED
jgi:TrmH family RNA methyltransferase